MKKLLISIVCFGFHFCGNAQIDTVQLNEYTVQDCSITVPNAIQNQVFTDSILKAQPNFTLNNWLEFNTSFNLKTYGFGGVASPSFRGTSAAHTNLVINGIEINSPLLGFNDFNQTPIHLFGKLSLIEGAGSIFSGGTGMGASIQFSTQSISKSQLIFTQSLGSFGSYTTQIDAQIKLKKNRSLRVNYWQRGAENNFRYINPLSNSEAFQIQRNAATIQRFGNLNYSFMHKKWIANFSFIGGASTQEIPANLTSITTNQYQESETLKGIFSIQQSKRKWSQKHSFAVLYDKNEYTIQNAIDTNAFVALKQSNSLNYSFSNNLQYALANFNAFTTTQVSSFEKVPQVFESKWIHTLAYTWNHFKGLLTVKQQLQSNFKNEWFLPSVLIAYKKNVPLETSINVASVYRAPTLNDLYWNPGGNENLNPEKGFTAEWNLNYKRLNYSIQSTVFYSNLNESIQWQPTNLGFWQAANFGSTQIKGVSLRAYIKVFQSKNFTLKLRTNTTFSEAKIQDKQLIYAPNWVSSNWLIFNYKTVDFGYNVNYTSKRFINFENTWYLPYYTLHNAFVQGLIKVKNTKISLRFDVFNLLNTNYYSVVYQPMPQRWYQAHVSIPIQLKQHEKGH